MNLIFHKGLDTDVWEENPNRPGFRRCTKEYIAWSNMKGRCTNKKDPKYPSYGGRGIQVCDQWKNDFRQFLSDVGKAPFREAYLDRENNDGNYEPGNVRWTTASKSVRNRRIAKMVTIDGKTKNLVEWSKISSVNFQVIWQRLEKGIDPKLAVFTPTSAIAAKDLNSQVLSVIKTGKLREKLTS